jgi:hypothetical protein
MHRTLREISNKEDGIHLVQDIEQWQALVNMLINLCGPLKKLQIS